MSISYLRKVHDQKPLIYFVTHKYTYISMTHTEKSILNLVNSKPNVDFNYPFPIDLAQNGFPFCAISIGKR